FLADAGRPCETPAGPVRHADRPRPLPDWPPGGRGRNVGHPTVTADPAPATQWTGPAGDRPSSTGRGTRNADRTRAPQAAHGTGPARRAQCAPRNGATDIDGGGPMRTDAGLPSEDPDGADPRKAAQPGGDAAGSAAHAAGGPPGGAAEGE